MTDDKMRRPLPVAAAALLAGCCAVHLILLAAGVGALAAAVGASVVAVGLFLLGVGLWWATRRRFSPVSTSADTHPIVDAIVPANSGSDYDP